MDFDVRSLRLALSQGHRSIVNSAKRAVNGCDWLLWSVEYRLSSELRLARI